MEIMGECNVYVERKRESRWKVHRFGNGYAMFMDKNGDPWVTIGPNYGFTLLCYFFITGLGVILFTVISKASPEFWYTRYLALALLFSCYLALTCTVLLNPGVPRKQST